MVLKGNSVGNRICLKFGAGINELSGRGRQMSSQLELNLRAALCRQLAKREPANRLDGRGGKLVAAVEREASR
jgi:hypothetical protein